MIDRDVIIDMLRSVRSVARLARNTPSIGCIATTRVTARPVVARRHASGLTPLRAADKARAILESGKAVSVATLEPEVKEALVCDALSCVCWLYHDGSYAMT